MNNLMSQIRASARRARRDLEKGHYTSVMPFLGGARYVVCRKPGCGHVIRNTLIWPPMQPLIHNGRKGRRQSWRRGSK